MSLKQSIVIVNEYTVKSKSGKGSRGSSPGKYTLRYMARELATETLAPIRKTPIEDFMVRYMARESATERATSVTDAKESMKEAQGLGGVAFGYGVSSMSDAEIRAGADDVQRLFDEGHTVLKTVVSFDHEYLKKHGIIEPDFEIKGRGDYRGNIDQMKLRLAVMAGLERVSRSRYDDLRYVGVIQVDTEHVHCHLSMVDAGRGRLAEDGTQRGKIDDVSKSLFRRGVDAWLDEKQTVKHLSSAVGYERRNVTTFVKRWAHQQMLKESLPQFLLACLPEDRRLWRSGTNDRRMRKANTLVTSMVTDMLSRPDSPMGIAMATVQDYANTRREQEGLTNQEWMTLVERGRAQIVDGCVNGVYALLRSLPDDALRVKTPMLDTMSMDFEQITASAAESKRLLAEGKVEDLDPMIDFGFKLRTYANRLEHHREQREEFHEQVRTWDRAHEIGATSEASRVLRRFYEEEEEYHAMCMAKYQSFLPQTGSTHPWFEQWQSVAVYGERVLSLEMMTKDDSLRKLGSEDEAEARGVMIYGQRGGSLMRDEIGRSILESRLSRARLTYERKVEDLRVELAGEGLKLKIVEFDEAGESRVLVGSDEAQDPARWVARSDDRPSESGRMVASTTVEAEYPFEDVKGLDMHHMRYDFVSDTPVGERTRNAFVQTARRRKDALDAAVEYLERTDQGSMVASLPVSDIEAMNEMADRLAVLSGSKLVLPSRISELREQTGTTWARSRTVVLDEDVSEQIDEVIASQSRAIVAAVVPVQYREARRAALRLAVEPDLPTDLSMEFDEGLGASREDVGLE